MIEKMTNDQIELFFNLIKNSFQQTALEVGITKENCPGNSAFMTMQQYKKALYQDLEMFGYFDDENDATLIGCVGIQKKGHHAYTIKYLAVNPNRRHQGIGLELMEYVESKIKKLGISKVTLGMVLKNKKLLTWYQRQGYMMKKQSLYKERLAIAFMEKIL